MSLASSFFCAEFNALFDRLDLDGSGSLDKHEVIEAAHLLSMTKEEASEWFDKMDESQG